MTALHDRVDARPLRNAGAAAAAALLMEDLRELDELLVEVAGEADRQRHLPDTLRAELRNLALASETVLLTALLGHSGPEVRLLLGQLHRRISLLLERTRRSDRCTGQLQECLRHAKLRLQVLGQELCS